MSNVFHRWAKIFAGIYALTRIDESIKSVQVKPKNEKIRVNTNVSKYMCDTMVSSKDPAKEELEKLERELDIIKFKQKQEDKKREEGRVQREVERRVRERDEDSYYL